MTTQPALGSRRKNFGGITGDLCGMCITVCETVTLLCAVIGGIALR